MEQKQTDVVIKTLIEKQTTISTMESCTSGLIASMITDTEGASAIFPGGYVTYSNETKMLVGVDEQVLRQYGVYSRMCTSHGEDNSGKASYRYFYRSHRYNRDYRPK